MSILFISNAGKERSVCTGERERKDLACAKVSRGARNNATNCYMIIITFLGYDLGKIELLLVANVRYLSLSIDNVDLCGPPDVL